jgi:predicted nucleic acid-binding Zn ribbon protein
MDCPKCGQWNPDDKRVCWRCDTELPRPVEKKVKKPTLFLGMPVWSWVLIVVMLVVLFAGQCLGPALVNGGG